MLKPGAIVASVLFIICGILGMAQDRPPGKVGTCSNSTLDEWGPERAAQARSFLAALKLAVRRRDKKTVASTVLYPLRLFVGGRETTVRDSAEFVKNYEQILQPRVVAAIVDQDPDCLFGNWQAPWSAMAKSGSNANPAANSRSSH